MGAPIDPCDFVHGMKVVDIGDARVRRGRSRRPISICKHLSLTYDSNERRIWCDDCQSEIEPFDAFMVLVGNMGMQLHRHNQREAAVKAAEAHALISRASKVMDEAWRRQKTVPMCPHCDKALLPEDIVGGVGHCSKELARAARKKSNPQQPGGAG